MLGVAVLGLSGCQSLTAGDLRTAEVRFVDTSVDAPALDFYVNGSGAAYNLGYATFTSYVDVSPGALQISANRANTGQSLATLHAALTGTHEYTAVVSNRLGNLQEHIYPDDTPPVTPGMISVRVLNEADGDPLDLYLVPGSGSLATTPPLVTDLGYTGDAGYVRVPANATYTLIAVPAGSVATTANAVSVGATSLHGGSGAVRTVVLSNAPQANGKAIYAFVLDDADVS